MTETGELAILNVGAGDLSFVFNNANPEETAKAVKTLLDMRARGYAIMVQLQDGTYQRAVDIDGSTGRYVLVVPDDVAVPADAEVVATKKRRGRPPGSRRVSVPVRTSRAVGIARSAGG